MFGNHLATGPALGTLDGARRMRGHFPHVTGLHFPAELSSQLVSPGFNHGVVRNAHDGAVGTIQGHRDSGGLMEQLFQLFLKRCRCISHESTSVPAESRFPKCQADAFYQRIDAFLY
jgi:hypothetical protein